MSSTGIMPCGTSEIMTVSGGVNLTPNKGAGAAVRFRKHIRKERLRSAMRRGLAQCHLDPIGKDLE